jgi:hypothetical protein
MRAVASKNRTQEEKEDEEGYPFLGFADNAAGHYCEK